MSNARVSPDTLASWFAREFVAIRERTARILEMLTPEAYTEQGIWERYPPCFFDGHIDAFVQARIFRDILGEESSRPDLDVLFFRGMAPLTPEEAKQKLPEAWPTREETEAYKESVRRRLFEYLDGRDFDKEDHPLLRNGYAFHASLEHECMHQESILFVIHRLPYDRKPWKPGFEMPPERPAPAPRTVDIPSGTALLGAREGEFPFGWDNEFSCTEVAVPAFSIDAYNVTNAQFLEFVEEGGYRRREFWTEKTWPWIRERGLEHPVDWVRRGKEWRYHGFFEESDLPRSWPVYVTHAEAEAFARFRRAALPTEAQWHRAAAGDDPARLYPWGPAAPAPDHGNFDFRLRHPESVGSFPAGASPYGIHELVGNGWEWTSSLLEPFPGFSPMQLYPQYSADHFDGEHYALKGASCFTAAPLLRRSFRTWYRWNYAYAYTAFRLARTI